MGVGVAETLKYRRNGGGTRKVELVGAEERMPMTLEAWMPKKVWMQKKVELTNKYQILQVEDEKEEVIGAIKGGDGDRSGQGDGG